MRRAFFTGGTLVMATAALIVPLPVLAMKPGPVLVTAEAVSIPGRPDVITGRLLATTVLLYEASTVATVAAAVDRHARLLRRQAVIPRGVGLRQAGLPLN